MNNYTILIQGVPTTLKSSIFNYRGLEKLFNPICEDKVSPRVQAWRNQFFDGKITAQMMVLGIERFVTCGGVTL